MAVTKCHFSSACMIYMYLYRIQAFGIDSMLAPISFCLACDESLMKARHIAIGHTLSVFVVNTKVNPNC